ncbi:VOC family protein [Corynebacterium cystitidis]|uniref:VOC family protein n=1 Tax=Corynebacterium cystitidis TaxID=35757 RepID=UPI00211E7AE1|nr:VOC family protein [Corynebacterium cystitidis]
MAFSHTSNTQTNSRRTTSTTDKTQYLDSVYAVTVVKDLSATRAWYEKLFGPAAVDPEPTTAEWKTAEGSWLQVTEDAERAGKSIAIIGTTDLDAQLKLCEDNGIATGELQDYGFIRLAIAEDPEGNQLQFVEEVTDS